VSIISHQWFVVNSLYQNRGVIRPTYLILNGTAVIASTTYMGFLAREGQDVGRIEAFISTSKITIDFWPHIIEGWGYGFIVSFICCSVLLLWSSLRTPNKSLNQTGANDAPPG